MTVSPETVQWKKGQLPFVKPGGPVGWHLPGSLLPQHLLPGLLLIPRQGWRNLDQQAREELLSSGFRPQLRVLCCLLDLNPLTSLHLSAHPLDNFL